MSITVPNHNPVTFTVLFDDSNGNPFDPATGIQIVVTDPTGTPTTYAYPAQVTKNAIGSYTVTDEVTLKGTYTAVGQGTLGNGDQVTSPTYSVKVV